MYGPAGVDVFPTSGVIGVIPSGKFSGGSDSIISKLSKVMTIPNTSVAAAPIAMYLIFMFPTKNPKIVDIFYSTCSVFHYQFWQMNATFQSRTKIS